MRALLHIGCEKTGTSTVQSWCERNRAALARRGILYPRSLGFRNHMRAACYAGSRDRVEDLLKVEKLFDPEALQRFRATLPDMLRREVQESSCHTLLVSNEHLSSRLTTPAEAQRILALVQHACGSDADIRVVHYVRRQDELLASIYSTNVKSGSTEPFRPVHGLDDPRLNPLPVLDLWASVFGEAAIEVPVFDRATLAKGDIVQDLLLRIGVDVAAAGSEFVAVPETNRRLGAASLEFLRLFNAAVPRFNEKGLNPDRRGIVTALEELDTEEADQALMTPAQAAAFMERFAAINQEIARRFLRREDGQLFPPKPPAQREAAASTLDGPTAVRIAAALWLWQRQTAARAGLPFPDAE